MSKPEISVIITCHAEEPQWVRRAIKSVLTQKDAPSFEVIVIADKPKDDTWRAALAEVSIAASDGVRIEKVEHGDLGLSRNHGFGMAIGRYCCTLDADDMYGCLWLRDAYAYARRLRDERKSAGLDPEAFVLHQEFMVMFGSANFIHRCIGDDSPEFDAKDLLQWNDWPASAFAPRETFLKHPYFKAENGYGYEDFEFHVRSHGAGVSHRVVPTTCYAVRMKGDHTSMAARYVAANLVIPKQPLYDRRDIPDAKDNDRAKEGLIPKELHQQCLFAHYELGEYQLRIDEEMRAHVRRYPRQSYFREQGLLRDAIGDAKHAILTRELVRGGAEKYAIDWAAAIGKDAVIVETEPDQSPWLSRAESAGVRVIRWRPDPGLSPKEVSDAFRRALIQADLETTFICNAPIGWILLQENGQVLGKKVIAASFAPIPGGDGFSRCPPYFLKHVPQNLRIITDNQQHADRMIKFDPRLDISVVHPRATYLGQSKLSRITKDRLRFLWAGRGTAEKRPDLLPPLAAACEKFADIHVWGQVAPMNSTENLRFRGPFDGFEKIEGGYDAYLLTSLYEGCPNTAMEAILADLPVVGPKVGALPEFATATYDKFDPLAVASMLKEAAGKQNEVAKEKIRNWSDSFNDNVRAMVFG